MALNYGPIASDAEHRAFYRALGTHNFVKKPNFTRLAMRLNLELNEADVPDRRYHLPNHVAAKWALAKAAYQARGYRQAHPDLFHHYDRDVVQLGAAGQL